MKSLRVFVLGLLVVLTLGFRVEARDPDGPPFPLGLEADHWESVDQRLTLEFKLEASDLEANFVIWSRDLNREILWGKVNRSDWPNLFRGEAVGRRGEIWKVAIYKTRNGSLRVYLTQEGHKVLWIMKASQASSNRKASDSRP